MKLSVSLPEADLSFLDEYARHESLASRSAAVRAAITALQEAYLGDLYEAAWDEAADDLPAWDATLKDGLSDEAW